MSKRSCGCRTGKSLGVYEMCKETDPSEAIMSYIELGIDCPVELTLPLVVCFHLSRISSSALLGFFSFMPFYLLFNIPYADGDFFIVSFFVFRARLLNVLSFYIRI